MKFYEEITRTYENGVKIKYEVIEFDTIYIHSITSMSCKNGNGTESMKLFLEEFKNKNIYLFSTNELGVDKKVLDVWYEKLGFIKNETDVLPYNVTHCKGKFN
jgi:hypothetical protein